MEIPFPPQNSSGYSTMDPANSSNQPQQIVDENPVIESEEEQMSPEDKKIFGKTKLVGVENVRQSWMLHDPEKLTDMLRKSLICRDDFIAQDLDSTSSSVEGFDTSSINNLLDSLIINSLDSRCSSELVWQYGMLLLSEKSADHLNAHRFAHGVSSQGDLTLPNTQTSSEGAPDSTIQGLFYGSDEDEYAYSSKLKTDGDEDSDEEILRAIEREATLDSLSVVTGRAGLSQKSESGRDDSQAGADPTSSSIKNDEDSIPGDEIYRSLVEMIKLMSRTQCSKREMLLEAIMFLLRSGRTSLISDLCKRFQHIIRWKQYRNDERIGLLLQAYQGYAAYIHHLRDWLGSRLQELDLAKEQLYAGGSNVMTFGCPANQSQRDQIMDRLSQILKGDVSSFNETFLHAYLDIACVTGEGLPELREIIETNAKNNPNHLNAQLYWYYYLLGCIQEGQSESDVDRKLLEETFLKIIILDPSNALVYDHYQHDLTSAPTAPEDAGESNESDELIEKISHLLEHLMYDCNWNDCAAWRQLLDWLKQGFDSSFPELGKFAKDLRDMWKDCYREIFIAIHFNASKLDVSAKTGTAKELLKIKRRAFLVLDGSSEQSKEFAAAVKSL